MPNNISIYLDDALLKRLDAEVEKRAAIDRSKGLEGRQVTSRSKLIQQILGENLGKKTGLRVEEIRYAAITLGEEFGAAKISLFGSYARGEQTPSSDVDILLEKGNIKGMQVLDFQEALANKLGKPVDVVTTAGASERFLNKIKQDEVVLYEAS